VGGQIKHLDNLAVFINGVRYHHISGQQAQPHRFGNTGFAIAGRPINKERLIRVYCRANLFNNGVRQNQPVQGFSHLGIFDDGANFGLCFDYFDIMFQRYGAWANLAIAFQQFAGALTAFIGDGVLIGQRVEGAAAGYLNEVLGFQGAQNWLDNSAEMKP
jgi:hypothetical protein